MQPLPERRRQLKKARKYALLLAFAVASTLALAAAACWWAAVRGGEHRDRAFDLRPHIGWRPQAKGARASHPAFVAALNNLTELLPRVGV